MPDKIINLDIYHDHFWVACLGLYWLNQLSSISFFVSLGLFDKQQYVGEFLQIDKTILSAENGAPGVSDIVKLAVKLDDAKSHIIKQLAKHTGCVGIRLAVKEAGCSGLKYEWLLC